MQRKNHFGARALSRSLIIGLAVCYVGAYFGLKIFGQAVLGILVAATDRTIDDARTEIDQNVEPLSQIKARAADIKRHRHKTHNQMPAVAQKTTAKLSPETLERLRMQNAVFRSSMRSRDFMKRALLM